MVVYLTKNSDAMSLLQEQYFLVAGVQRIPACLSEEPDLNNVITAKNSAIRRSCAARIEYVQNVPPKATIIVRGRRWYPSVYLAADHTSRLAEVVRNFPRRHDYR